MCSCPFRFSRRPWCLETLVADAEEWTPSRQCLPHGQVYGTATAYRHEVEPLHLWVVDTFE